MKSMCASEVLIQGLRAAALLKALFSAWVLHIAIPKNI